MDAVMLFTQHKQRNFCKLLFPTAISATNPPPRSLQRSYLLAGQEHIVSIIILLSVRKDSKGPLRGMARVTVCWLQGSAAPFILTRSDLATKTKQTVSKTVLLQKTIQEIRHPLLEIYILIWPISSFPSPSQLLILKITSCEHSHDFTSPRSLRNKILLKHQLYLE